MRQVTMLSLSRLAGLSGHFATRRARRERAVDLYGRIVQAARHPGFYDSLGVKDSVDGRFDMIVLHLHLVLDRLSRIEGEESRDLQREVQEVFVTDMDRSLREMGVGDLSVGKKVRTMAAACHGRLVAYGAAGDRDQLADALERNVWRGAAPSAGARAALVGHVLDQRTRLARLDDARILAGAVEFGNPETALGDRS